MKMLIFLQIYQCLEPYLKINYNQSFYIYFFKIKGFLLLNTYSH